MNIFEILKNLLTNKSSKWINEVNNEDIAPFVIQRWLAHCDSLRTHARWLDKFVFDLPPRMYLTLAWSLLPKFEKQPFIRYTKKAEDDTEYDFILSRVRTQFNIADNDFHHMKADITEAIKSDMINWFSYYGVRKKYWDKYKLNFNHIKNFGDRKPVEQDVGLGAWGL